MYSLSSMHLGAVTARKLLPPGNNLPKNSKMSPILSLESSTLLPMKLKELMLRDTPLLNSTLRETNKTPLIMTVEERSKTSRNGLKRTLLLIRHSKVNQISEET